MSYVKCAGDFTAFPLDKCPCAKANHRHWHALVGSLVRQELRSKILNSFFNPRDGTTQSNWKRWMGLSGVSCTTLSLLVHFSAAWIFMTVLCPVTDKVRDAQGDSVNANKVNVCKHE